MPRRPKQGIEFAGWSVDIFDGDTKIDKLLDAHGWIGFGIYFYLCQMAYKFDGYFYRWAYDDSASTARRMGGGVGSGTVEETVRYCLQIGLFDKGLFDMVGILTSKGIQRRFLAAIQGRRVKSVISNYWLLDDTESEGLDKCASNDYLQPTNAHLQGANSDLQPTNDPNSRVEESRVYLTVSSLRSETVCSKPKIVFEPPVIVLPLNDGTDYQVSQEQFHEWESLYPAVDVMQQLRNMRGWLIGTPTKRKTKRGIVRFITGWLSREQDRGGSVKQEKKHSGKSNNVFLDLLESGALNDKS